MTEMNELKNEIKKIVLKRRDTGHIQTIVKKNHLGEIVSKEEYWWAPGFPTVTLTSFRAYAKQYGVGV